MTPVVVKGFGLHSGEPVRVELSALAGDDVILRQTFALAGHPVPTASGVAEPRTSRVGELSVASTDRATTVQARAGLLRVATIEHAFAGLAGMGIHGGVLIAIDGPEMPLLDGGAAAWCEAFASLRVAPFIRRPLRVTRQAVLQVGRSTYEFTPGDEVAVDVSVDFNDARIAPEARWGGDSDDFRRRIAPARTFALERDIEEFVRRGLARHVAPEAVVVVTPDAILSSGSPFSADEPARHKLLDALGDLYVYGGPPRGRVRAFRPGHAANHRAFSKAIAEGILARG